MTLDDFLLDIHTRADAGFHSLLQVHPVENGCVPGCKTCQAMAIFAGIATDTRRWLNGCEPAGPPLEDILSEGAKR